MSEFTGTLALTRLALRRDRVLLPVVIAAFVLTVVSSATATVGLYPSVASRFAAASAVNDIPALWRCTAGCGTRPPWAPW